MYGNLHTGANDETYRDLCVCISNRATEAREAEVELHKMRKVVLRMQRVKVAATMNAWIEFYQERKNNKMLLTRAARKMQSRALASSWEGWIDFVESRYHTRNVVRRVFGNLTNRVVGLAFYSWTELVGDHIRQQLLIARCAAKIKNRCVAGAFERTGYTSVLNLCRAPRNEQLLPYMVADELGPTVKRQPYHPVRQISEYSPHHVSRVVPRFHKINPALPAAGQRS